MKLIDKSYLKPPYYGTRRIKDWLYDEHGLIANREYKTAQALDGYRNSVSQANLNLANRQHKAYPYLLRGLDIHKPNTSLVNR